MPKPGIRVIEDQPGTGPPAERGDTIEVTYGLTLNRGDVVQPGQRLAMVLGDRSVIAGLNYGIEGMRQGGRRKFRAGPHLCYGDDGIPGTIPANAVLIFDVTLSGIKRKPNPGRPKV